MQTNLVPPLRPAPAEAHEDHLKRNFINPSWRTRRV